MVSLELVAVASPADALKIVAAVWISSLQPTDEPCRHDVVHMAPYPSLPDICATGFHLAFSSQGGDAALPPFLPRRLRPRPLAVQVAPGHGPFLRAESCLAKTAATLTIGAATVAEGLHHLGSCISALWTRHPFALLPVGRQPQCRLQKLDGLHEFWSCGTKENVRRRIATPQGHCVSSGGKVSAVREAALTYCGIVSVMQVHGVVYDWAALGGTRRSKIVRLEIWRDHLYRGDYGG